MKKLHYIVALLMLLLPVQAFATDSHINLPTGSQFQDFDLFPIHSAGLPSTLLITYESLSSHKSPMGRGWSNTLDLYSYDGGKGAIVQKGVDGNLYMFVFQDGKFIPQMGDDAILVKGKDGSFTVERGEVTYRYNKDGGLATISDRSGGTTRFEFAGEKVMRVVTSDKETISFSYDGDKLTRITDPAGKAYTFSYDDNGYPVAINYPDNTAWRFANDPFGLILTKTTPDGIVVTYVYDSRRRVISGTKGADTQTYTYPTSTERERTVTYTENGKVNEVTYDTHTGTVPRKVDPNGGVTTYTYDKLKNVTSETDQFGRTNAYTYDDKSRKTSHRDPDGNLTTYQYDGRGNLVKVESKGGTETFEYDDTGRLTKSSGPFLSSVTYSYDAKGNLVSVTGPDGKEVDAAGAGRE